MSAARSSADHPAVSATVAAYQLWYVPASFDDRPVAAPHEALRAEDLDEMVEVAAQLIDGPSGPGLGDESRHLAAHARIVGDRAHQARPRLPHAARDVGLGAVIDDDGEIRMAIEHGQQRGQLRAA